MHGWLAVAAYEAAALVFGWETMTGAFHRARDGRWKGNTPDAGWKPSRGRTAARAALVVATGLALWDLWLRGRST